MNQMALNAERRRKGGREAGLRVIKAEDLKSDGFGTEFAYYIGCGIYPLAGKALG